MYDGNRVKYIIPSIHTLFVTEFVTVSRNLHCYLQECNRADTSYRTYVII